MKLRFTIRDLLWLTLIVAMAIGWLITYRTMQAKIDEFNEHKQFLTPISP